MDLYVGIFSGFVMGAIVALITMLDTKDNREKIGISLLWVAIISIIIGLIIIFKR